MVFGLLIIPFWYNILAALPRSVYKADGKLHEQERDVAKFWKNGHIRIALIGLENQTEADADMPFRVISYDGAVYRDEMNADEKGKPKNRYPVITLVLYFGYEKHWDKPLTLKGNLAIPAGLEPYVNDYKVNLFEIAWLPDETIAKFQSDFRLVADYFSQKRKNKEYDPPKQELAHVKETLELFSVLLDDDRFVQVYNEQIEGRPTKLDAYLDRILDDRFEKRREESKIEMVQEMLKDKLDIDAIVRYSRLSKDKVMDLAKQQRLIWCKIADKATGVLGCLKSVLSGAKRHKKEQRCTKTESLKAA